MFNLLQLFEVLYRQQCELNLKRKNNLQTNTKELNPKNPLQTRRLRMDNSLANLWQSSHANSSQCFLHKSLIVPLQLCLSQNHHYSFNVPYNCSVAIALLFPHHDLFTNLTLFPCCLQLFPHNFAIVSSQYFLSESNVIPSQFFRHFSFISCLQVVVNVCVWRFWWCQDVSNTRVLQVKIQE